MFLGIQFCSCCNVISHVECFVLFHHCFPRYMCSVQYGCFLQFPHFVLSLYFAQVLYTLLGYCSSCPIYYWYKYLFTFHARCISIARSLYFRNFQAYFFITFLFPEIAIYRVIHKSVKHFKNSQQIDYATDHGNSYVDRERN